MNVTLTQCLSCLPLLMQTPLSGVQRNLFSASSPLFPPEGLNGLRPSSSPFASPFASPFLSPFSLGPPVFSSHLQRERPPTPVKDTPPRVSIHSLTTLCKPSTQLHTLSRSFQHTHTHTHVYVVCEYICTNSV
jgi:hypothetical protein